MLKKYNILFDNFNETSGIFFELVKTESVFIGSDFRVFVSWCFDELFEKKVIDKEGYDSLQKWLEKFDIDSITKGATYFGGGGL